MQTSYKKINCLCEFSKFLCEYIENKPYIQKGERSNIQICFITYNKKGEKTVYNILLSNTKLLTLPHIN
jgi:hypothetical protein